MVILGTTRRPASRGGRSFPRRPRTRHARKGMATAPARRRGRAAAARAASCAGPGPPVEAGSDDHHGQKRDVVRGGRCLSAAPTRTAMSPASSVAAAANDISRTRRRRYPAGSLRQFAGATADLPPLQNYGADDRDRRDGNEPVSTASPRIDSLSGSFKTHMLRAENAHEAGFVKPLRSPDIPHNERVGDSKPHIVRAESRPTAAPACRAGHKPVIGSEFALEIADQVI